jgi:hypothetical protein
MSLAINGQTDGMSPATTRRPWRVVCPITPAPWPYRKTPFHFILA